MNGLFLKWLVVTATIMAIPNIVSGVEVKSIGTAVFAAFVLGILNIVLKPLLVILTLPFTIVTFGLFLIFINGLVFQMADFFVPGLKVDSFGSAVLASLLVSLSSWIMNLSFRSENGRPKVVFRKDPTSDVIDLQQSESGRWE